MNLLSWPERTLAALIAFRRFIVGRLGERSTWTAIGVGVMAAAALEAPWSFVFLAISIIGVLIPDGPALPDKPA